ncbi:unnamed protein product [Meganyctiphanes norvegica]|uniref:Uncharacterized protein n=1 Tax=Meganyctiphanes norvegica TaxID=48144 RepID=A0AAV2QFA9_MEGNR
MMRNLVFVSVVLGVTCASPFLPRDDPNVAAARARFIQEYNRLAALAAAAPDIHIIMDDRTHPSVVNNNLLQQQHTGSQMSPVVRHQQKQHTPQLPVKIPQHHQQPQSLSQQHPANPAFNTFSFSTTLGDNQQFFPQVNFIQPATPPAPTRMHNRARPVHFPVPIAQPTTTFNGEPIIRWTGPLADTVPAGVNGLPQQVSDTPEVAAAKASHFRAHALARAFNPQF